MPRLLGGRCTWRFIGDYVEVAENSSGPTLRPYVAHASVNTTAYACMCVCMYASMNLSMRMIYVYQLLKNMYARLLSGPLRYPDVDDQCDLEAHSPPTRETRKFACWAGAMAEFHNNFIDAAAQGL